MNRKIIRPGPKFIRPDVQISVVNTEVRHINRVNPDYGGDGTIRIPNSWKQTTTQEYKLRDASIENFYLRNPELREIFPSMYPKDKWHTKLWKKISWYLPRIAPLEDNR